MQRIVIASLLVAALALLVSTAGRRWNARGGLNDPLPSVWLCEPGSSSCPSAQGKVALVTGGNAGIGLEMVRGLYRAGYKVVMGCRNVEAARRAREQLLAEERQHADSQLRGGSIEEPFAALDLAQIGSVAVFASAFAGRFDRLDVLVLNAGVWYAPNATTHGLSESAQVNHYAGFLLTQLLTPKLLDAASTSVAQPGQPPAAASRVVVVSSGLAAQGRDFRHDPGLLSPEWGASGGLAMYATTKLMNVISARLLAAFFEEKYPGYVRVNAVHPGIIATNLHRPENDPSPWVVHAVLRPLLYLAIGIDAWQGAQSTLYLATHPDVEASTGQYYHGSLPRDPPPLAVDDELAATLWRYSVEKTRPPA